MINHRRRSLLQLTAMSAALLSRSVYVAETPSGKALSRFPFTLGVASGFPTSRGVVLWTRLAPEPAAEDGLGGMPSDDVKVRWEVAGDQKFRRILQRGEIIATAAQAHSVRVQVSSLQPARDYWYRFLIGDNSSSIVSSIGRTRTLPAAEREPREFRIAVANCQHYEHGQFAAFRHIAQGAPELVLHLGDYIYEGATTPNRVRAHNGGLCRTLAEYRRRYAQYQMDPALQAAHAAAPWICTWDDHEVANDYSGVFSGRAEDPAVFAQRRAAAYQAYCEHLPIPPAVGTDPSNVLLYARRQLGSLADLHVLDQRQYRSAQACPQPGRAGGNQVAGDCADLRDASRTMLGVTQEAWLNAGFAATRARWNLLAQGTVFSKVDEEPGENRRYAGDNWNGYPMARQRVLDSLQKHRVQNPVVLSGDIHAFVAGNVRATPERPDSALLATEIAATSVSSDPRPPRQFEEWLAENPDLLLAEGRWRGYALLRLSARHLQADLMAVDDRDDVNSGQHLLQSLVVEAGVPELHRA
ncbi:MAG: alkaline phosphatase D family protein [Pseudoxanthomonas sp.]